ncbi:hypothetical protein LLE49_28060 [Alicyclobacillus tolerans]|uniref:hypothetical protein n=1 Tax=Alicyclobacillus tolerans TaxID=90970 RepID=UPI001F4580D7|nr:hypothetical protein [Alicyclobacillus tolerans]MCF8568579.1 hypothetical protein [Alicyclobacillus tolerans]
MRMLSWTKQPLQVLRNQPYVAGVNGSMPLRHMQQAAWSPSLTVFTGLWRVRPLIHKPHSIVSDASLDMSVAGWPVLSGPL